MSPVAFFFGYKYKMDSGLNLKRASLAQSPNEQSTSQLAHCVHMGEAAFV
jgi:hypothetical protein